jgi:RNA polymerase sigma factor (sigma-70 family)
MTTEERPASEGGPGNFETTRWSVIVAAREPSAHTEAALASLCQTYWYPLYAFARRRGFSSEDAQDLTQGFFASLLRRDFLRNVRREKGKFRSFLLASFTNYMAHEHERSQALKRGGGSAPLSIDVAEAEGRYALEPIDIDSPDRIYDRRWALTLLENVLKRLRAEHESRNQMDIFEAFKPALTGEDPLESHAALAKRFGASEGAIKVSVFRFRRRYRELIRDEIAQTVAAPDEIDAELKHLLAALT